VLIVYQRLVLDGHQLQCLTGFAAQEGKGASLAFVIVLSLSQGEGQIKFLHLFGHKYKTLHHLPFEREGTDLIVELLLLKLRLAHVGEYFDFFEILPQQFGACALSVENGGFVNQQAVSLVVSPPLKVVGDSVNSLGCHVVQETSYLELRLTAGIIQRLKHLGSKPLSHLRLHLRDDHLGLE